MNRLILSGLILFTMMSCGLEVSPAEAGVHITSGTATALKFGIHEIMLTGNGSVSNPFNTDAKVTFTAPSGTAKTVNGFYDGGNTWRARVYVNETGTWTWSSVSSNDSSLNNKSGTFAAAASSLPGKLKKHTSNPRSWMTDNGEDFINIGDTAYWLFDTNKTQWQQYITEDANQGVTSLRVDTFLILGDTWDIIWQDTSRTKFNLSTFQTIDTRIQWILNNYPGFNFSSKFFPEPNLTPLMIMCGSISPKQHAPVCCVIMFPDSPLTLMFSLRRATMSARRRMFPNVKQELTQTIRPWPEK